MAKSVAKMGKMRLLPLVAATYFMVSGGPYGLEDIIGKAGYGRALLLLLLVPLFWSLPTALMVGELASSMPYEGGFYYWVRRAMGPFWGFQEGWLSLTASVFDMAIYPTTFVLYLTHIAPGLTAGHRGLLLKLGIVGISSGMRTCWTARPASSSAAMRCFSLRSRMRSRARIASVTIPSRESVLMVYCQCQPPMEAYCFMPVRRSKELVSVRRTNQ